MALTRRRFGTQGLRLTDRFGHVNALISFVHKRQDGLTLKHQTQPTDAAVLMHLAFGTPGRFQNIAMLATDHQRSPGFTGPDLIPPKVVAHGLRPHQATARLGQQTG